MATTRTTKAWNPKSIMLFREDLEELIKLFQSVVPGSAVSIEDEESQYPSLDELLVQKGPNVINLRIVNAAVGIKLQLRRFPTATSTTTLATTTMSDEADLTFYRAKEFLEEKKRPNQFWLGVVVPAICISLIPLLGFVLYLHRMDVPPLRISVALSEVFLALSISVLLVSPLFRLSSTYRVTLKTEQGDASFVKRNRDTILVSLLFFAFGIAATLILQYLRQ